MSHSPEAQPKHRPGMLFGVWPFTLNVIDQHKGTVPDDRSVRYEPFVAKPERSPLVVRSLRGWGIRPVRLADRLETA